MSSCGSARGRKINLFQVIFCVFCGQLATHKIKMAVQKKWSQKAKRYRWCPTTSCISNTLNLVALCINVIWLYLTEFIDLVLQIWREANNQCVYSLYRQHTCSFAQGSYTKTHIQMGGKSNYLLTRFSIYKINENKTCLSLWVCRHTGSFGLISLMNSIVGKKPLLIVLFCKDRFMLSTHTEAEVDIKS